MFFPERVRTIKPSDRVLEVGPGGVPHPRADIFLEKIFDDPEQAKGQRGGAPKLKTRKKVVHYDGRRFPFEDGAFDYVICSHVLEHVDDVDQFVGELMRVGKAGYLEFPTIYWDYLYGIAEHTMFLFKAGSTIRWMPQAETGLDGWQSVRVLFNESRTKGYTRLITTLKTYLFQGFEWQGQITTQRVRSINDLVFNDDDICLSPFSLFPKGNSELVGTGGRESLSLILMGICNLTTRLKQKVKTALAFTGHRRGRRTQR